MKILLVDDNNVDMKEFRDLLTLEGHEVDHVHNLPELQIILSNSVQYQGLILDLMFPVESGISIIESEFGYRMGPIFYDQYIRTNYPKVPFIILTAMDPSISMFQQMKNHMSRYKSFKGIFQKPVEAYEVIKGLCEKT